MQQQQYCLSQPSNIYPVTLMSSTLYKPNELNPTLCRLLDVARSAGLLSSKEENLTLHQYLHAYLSGHQPPVSPGAAFDMALHDHVDDEAAALDERVSSVATEVAKYGVVREVAAGEVLYDWGEQPHEFYLLLKVRLCVVTDERGGLKLQRTGWVGC